MSLPSLIFPSIITWYLGINIHRTVLVVKTANNASCIFYMKAYRFCNELWCGNMKSMLCFALIISATQTSSHHNNEETVRGLDSYDCQCLVCVTLFSRRQLGKKCCTIPSAEDLFLQFFAYYTTNHKFSMVLISTMLLETSNLKGFKFNFFKMFESQHYKRQCTFDE